MFSLYHLKLFFINSFISQVLIWLWILMHFFWVLYFGVNVSTWRISVAYRPQKWMTGHQTPIKSHSRKWYLVSFQHSWIRSSIKYSKTWSPKLKLINQNSPWETMTFRWVLCLSLGWTICSHHISFWNIIPKSLPFHIPTFHQYLNSHWTEEIVVQKSQSTHFSIIFSLSNSLFLKTI